MRTTSVLISVALVGFGCAQSTPWKDYRETPVIERGACATVIMPGEQAPLGSEPNCPNGYSSLGGATVYDEKDYQQPGSGKRALKRVARVPAAVLGAPVAAGAAAAKSARGASQSSSSRSGGIDPAQSTQDQVERMRREILERERMGRGQAPPAHAAGPAPNPAPQQVAARAPRAGGASIADELAALRGARASVTTPARDGAPAEPLRSAAAVSAPPIADRVADRDGDGAPDHWIYRDAQGRPEREQYDENGDARQDRTAWLDAVTGRETRVEEDANLDGRVDTWVEYVDGAPARQRRDTNHDGSADQWSYYDRTGKLARQEQDLDGDGYRNRETLYREGKLAKQRDDRDGDGRFDLVTTYDAEERIARRDEDRDGDGKIDARSIYEKGKLVRREVVTEALDDGDDLSQTEW
ncbi:MAG: hypothetical protein FJ091_14715 [Deltaproteobacteria bacterium]|nr:hypothetical protein [Deltaproteobacteria bacterium]